MSTFLARDQHHTIRSTYLGALGWLALTQEHPVWLALAQEHPLQLALIQEWSIQCWLFLHTQQVPIQAEFCRKSLPKKVFTKAGSRKKPPFLCSTGLLDTKRLLRSIQTIKTMYIQEKKNKAYIKTRYNNFSGFGIDHLFLLAGLRPHC